MNVAIIFKPEKAGITDLMQHEQALFQQNNKRLETISKNNHH